MLRSFKRYDECSVKIPKVRVDHLIEINKFKYIIFIYVLSKTLLWQDGKYFWGNINLCYIV